MMINRKTQSFVLYFVGVVLLLFGQRSFWEKYKDAQRQIAQEKIQQSEVEKVSNKPFETQKVEYDSITNTWKNEHRYFQTVHVGNVNFKALNKKGIKTTIEDNDDENASDSF